MAAAARDGEAGPLPELPELEAVGAPRPLPLKPPSRRGRCVVVLCFLPLLPTRLGVEREERGERGEGAENPKRQGKEARRNSKIGATGKQERKLFSLVSMGN